MDHIEIKGINAYGYVGFFEAEQQLGQWFCADLKLTVDLQPAAHSDALDMTVDYAQVIDETQQQISTSRVNLLETLAADILSTVLKIEKIRAVEITLTKVSAPIPNFSGTVAVRMTRSK